MTLRNSEKLSNFKVHELPLTVNEFCTFLIIDHLIKGHLIFTKLVKILQNYSAIKTLDSYTKSDQSVYCYSPSIQMNYLKKSSFCSLKLQKTKQTNKRSSNNNKHKRQKNQN